MAETVKIQRENLPGRDLSTQPLADGVASQTAGIIDRGNIDQTKTRSVNFIVEKNEGIYINLFHYLDPKLFRTYLSELFQGGHYLVGLQYQTIMDVLYDFRAVEAYREKLTLLQGDQVIKIAQGIRKFDPERTCLYRKPAISRDRKSVDYYFEPIYSEEQIEGKKVEKREVLDIDEFIAILWNEGIHFGLDIPAIERELNSDTKTRIPIAQEKDPIQGKDALVDKAISFDINRGVKDALSMKTDYLEYKQGCVHVDKNVVILRKKPGEPGILGWTIFGEKIDPKDIFDTSLESLVGTGVRFEMVKGYECIVSDYAGFPGLEEGIVVQGNIRRQGITKVHVDEKKVFKEIGMSTGKLFLAEEITSERDITLDVNAWKVTAKKDVEANVHAISDIKVHGSVIGVAQNTLLSDQHQRVSGMLSKGRIKSESGNITIDGYANNSYLEAKRGVVKGKDITNSIVFGQTVEITGTAFNSTIIADKVILHGRTIGCKIIAKEIEMKESSLKGEFENFVSIFYRDLSASIETKENLRKKKIIEIQEIESKLDAEIIKKFTALAKIDTGKRISMTRVIVELMQDQAKILEDQYKSLQSIYKSLAPILNQCGTNWKKIFILNKDLTQLTQEIETEKNSMKDNEKRPPKVGRISGPLHMQYINYLENRQLLDFTLDEISVFLRLVAGRDAGSEKFRLEKIN